MNTGGGWIVRDIPQSVDALLENVLGGWAGLQGMACAAALRVTIHVR